MKAIKKINNNFAICLDNNNNELIAFGKGIGFPSMPYEIEDLSMIDRTFYGVNPNYYDLLNEIPDDVFEISANIIEFAKKKIKQALNPNLIFTLADHINFSIQRYEKKIFIQMPITNDIRYLCEAEMEVGEAAIAFINRVKHIHLGSDEAASIAIHFMNAEVNEHSSKQEINEDVILEITSIIEEDFHLTIHKKDFNYSRFVSHMHYLFKRKDAQIEISSENKKIFDSLCQECKTTYACALHISEYMEGVMHWHLGEEELLYLMLHINRLCAREDCNQ